MLVFRELFRRPSSSYLISSHSHAKRNGKRRRFSFFYFSVISRSLSLSLTPHFSNPYRLQIYNAEEKVPSGGGDSSYSAERPQW